MNKRFAMATVGLAAGMAGQAAAQAPVTLYGVVDEALRVVNNQGRGSVKSVESGSETTSRFGLYGIEPLGGSLSAGFHLEHGLLADTGTPASSTLFWDRRATVSLLDKRLGEIRLGRDLVPTYANWGRYDPFSYIGLAGSNKFVSGTFAGPIRSAFGSQPNTTVRSSNSLQYLLPSGLYGLEGGLMVAPSENGTPASGAARLWGVRLGVATPGFGLSAATTTSENANTFAGKFKDRALAGRFAIGPVNLTAGWREFKYATAEQTHLMVGAAWATGTGTLKASWNRVDMSGTAGTTSLDANGAQQWALGYVHTLSKRTVLYSALARVNNDGAVAFAIPGGASGLPAGGRSTGYEAGVRHAF